MYIPKHFAVTDRKEVLNFLSENAFGQLVSRVEGRLFSTHVPFLVDAELATLVGHVAIQNPQWAALESQECLVTFLGPHDYVSPSWYTSAGVPTWNYQAVHVYGQCKVTQDHENLKQIIHTLTDNYEARQNAPWKPTYNETMLGNIVGLEITITEVQCKYKLSQNRSKEDRQQVSEQLKSKGNIALSKAIDRIE